MKVFVIACLAVAAVAQPQWGPIGYNGLTGFPGYTGLPLVQPALYTNPLWAKQPVVKPEDMKYEQKEEKVETYMKEEKKDEFKPLTYTTDIYGRPIAMVKPVEYKVEVQPKYVSKSGPVEHRVYKRDAEPIYPYAGVISPYTTAYTHGMVSPMVSPYTAGMVSPFTTAYKYNPVMYKSFMPQTVAKVTYSKPEIVSNAKTVADDSVSPFNYAGKNAYVADSEGALHIAKRDADAEPNHHFGVYNAAISPYYQPAVQSMYKNIYGQPIATPLYQQQYMSYAAKPFVPLAVPQYKVKSYSNDAVKSEDYASKGQYVAETEGSIHIAKRDADAEPLTYLKTAQGVQINRPYMPVYTNPIYNAASIYNAAPIFNKVPYTAGVYTGMPVATPFGYSGYHY